MIYTYIPASVTLSILKMLSSSVLLQTMSVLLSTLAVMLLNVRVDLNTSPASSVSTATASAWSQNISYIIIIPMII